MATKTKKTEVSKTTIKIQQFGSPIRRDSRQRLYLKSLGFGKKMNAILQVEDNQTVRGLLAKLPHMVRIVSE